MQDTNRISFELFKSNVCHRLKRLGDVDFLTETLNNNDIRAYYDMEWYPESFYLLAMTDYLSKENSVPLCEDYNDLRKLKLSRTIYPSGIIAMCLAKNSEKPKEEAKKEAIPEFLKYNIVECDIRDVV